MDKIQDIQNLYDEVREIIASARQNAVRSVDFCRVQMYWNIGQRIFETEQKGKERAEYGSYLLKNLAKRLEPEYGSGFSVRQLELCRQFYRIYPIANTLYSQLNWSQYKLLISISDEDKRAYYQLEAVNNCWTKRELERQINSQLYERLLLSNDKESVLAIARKERIPQQPQEIIKDPMVLEFLGLERKSSYYEKDLEQALITHLQNFLLELGNGFTFGILLCTAKNDTVVKMTLPEDNSSILASQYQLYLPTQDQLKTEVESLRRLAEESKE